MADVLFVQDRSHFFFCICGRSERFLLIQFYETETKTILYIMHKNIMKILYKTPVYKYIDRKYNKINENDYILI